MVATHNFGLVYVFKRVSFGNKDCTWRVRPQTEWLTRPKLLKVSLCHIGGFVSDDSSDMSDDCIWLGPQLFNKHVVLLAVTLCGICVI